MMERARLTSIELDSAPSPFALFDDWFSQAKEHEPDQLYFLSTLAGAA